jgi:hypothetical protein
MNRLLITLTLSLMISSCVTTQSNNPRNETQNLKGVCLSGFAEVKNKRPSTNKQGLIDSIKNGQYYIPDTRSAFDWGWHRNYASSCYRSQMWEELGFIVGSFGDTDDLAYFYLGRVAEEIGNSESALNYYSIIATKKSLSKCNHLFNNCDGIDPPNEAIMRISGIENLIHGKAVWDGLKLKKEISEFNWFITKFPNSRHAAEAKERRDYLSLGPNPSIMMIINHTTKYQQDIDIPLLNELQNTAIDRAFSTNDIRSYTELLEWYILPDSKKSRIYEKLKAIITPQIKILENSGDCDKATELYNTHLKIHQTTKDVYTVGICLSNHEFNNLLISSDPLLIYSKALKYEISSEQKNANILYKKLVSDFPLTDVGIKAAEKLAAISQAERKAEIEKAGRMYDRIANEIKEGGERRKREQFQNEQLKLQRNACEAARQTCLNSCPKRTSCNCSYCR